MVKKSELKNVEINLREYPPNSGEINVVLPDRPIESFTGLARSAETFDNQGHKNVRILTMHIVKGKIVKIDRSDAYASFEAISMLEMWTQFAIQNLGANWVEGKALSK